MLKIRSASRLVQFGRRGFRSDHHIKIASAVDELVKKELSPIAEEIDKTSKFPTQVMKALGDAGYLGILLPEEYGGHPADLLSFAIVVERIASVCPSVAWMTAVHASAASAIAKTGSPSLKDRLLPSIATGSLVGYAFTEANAGADWSAIEATAVPESNGSGYIVNGCKMFITMAGVADNFISLVATKRDSNNVGLTMLVLERKHEGFSNGSHFSGMGIRGTAWGELVVTNTFVPKDNVLGKEGQGTKVVFSMAQPYLVGGAAVAVGLASGLCEHTRKHLKERIVNGKAIGEKHGLHMRLMEISAKVEAARSLLYRACVEQDQFLLPFHAKLFASEAAIEVARAAMQLNGATGYVQGTLVERLTRDAFAIPLHFENNDMMKSFIGTMLLKQ